MNDHFFSYAWKNITRRTKITGFLFLCVLVSIFAAVLAVATYFQIKDGVALSRERFGADVIVYPYETEISDASMLYSGIADSVYMDQELLDDISNQYTEQVSPQFYLQTLPTSGCCETTEEMRLVGVDWDKEYIVHSYISGGSIDELGKDEIIAGCNTGFQNDQTYILNRNFTIVERLGETGTYLDESIIMSVDTLKELARKNFPDSFFNDRNPDDLITCALVKLKEGADPQEYVDSLNDINARAVIVSNTAESIENEISVLFRLLIGAAVIILILGLISIFSQINTLINSQYQEIGYLRAVGASKGNIYTVFALQIGIVVLIAGAAASIAGVLSAGALTAWIHERMTIPVSGLSAGEIVMFICGGLVLSIIISIISSIAPLRRAAGISPHESITRGDM